MEIRQRLLEAHEQRVREHGKPHDSIFRLCQEVGCSERDFFTEFSSLPALESAWWAGKLDAIIGAVEAGEAWAGFSARQRFLTFGYAYLEHSLDYRSVLLARLTGVALWERPAFLQGWEERFRRFAHDLLAHGRQSGELAERRLTSGMTRWHEEGLYGVFRALVDFHLRDTSPQFERSDAFLEKTGNLAFDLLSTNAVDSAMDLAKFLLSCKANSGATGCTAQ